MAYVNNPAAAAFVPAAAAAVAAAAQGGHTHPGGQAAHPAGQPAGSVSNPDLCTRNQCRRLRSSFPYYLGLVFLMKGVS